MTKLIITLLLSYSANDSNISGRVIPTENNTWTIEIKGTFKDFSTAQNCLKEGVRAIEKASSKKAKNKL